MPNHRLKIAAVLCLLFWGGLVAQQVWFLVVMPTPDDPRVAAFAERFRITSSITIGVTVTVGITLSILLLRRQTSGRALALAAFCAFVLWRHSFSNLDIYFRPPMGDGSPSAALAGWWRVHAHRAWIDLPSIVFLAAVALFLGFQSYAIRRGNRLA